MSIKDIAIISLSASVAGAAAVGLCYIFTNTAVFAELKDQVLVSKSIKDWEILGQEIGKKNDIPEDLKKIIDSKNAGKKLKTWCETQYNKDYFNLFINFEERDDRKKTTEKYCVLKIEERIGSNRKATKRAELNKKLEALKKHDDYGMELSDPLVTIKNRQEIEKDVAIRKLFHWCKSIYKSPYQHETQNEWLLAKSYCIKDDSPR